MKWILFLCVLVVSIQTMAQTTSELAWPKITRENKPWTRWWWLGSAVDKPNLTRELEQIASHGFGGVEITPLYGAVGFEARYIDFLTPKWMEMLEFTGTEGKRLGIGIDMATGTGWPFGGPWITPADADASLVRDLEKLAEKPTRMKVKRAAPGDEGWVVNPFSVTAVNLYLKPFDEPFAKFPKGLVRSQFHDSFEYSGNWTHELPAKFAEMHGYKLEDHVKALWGEGDPDTCTRVLSDYRETLSQMHLDYVKVWVDWSHAHGQLARNQAHGSPGNLLDLYAVADIPETEIFGSIEWPIPGVRHDAEEIATDRGRTTPSPLVAKFASSAAHVTGKPLASCETFTWLREHFRASLSEMKPEADNMFLAGINHLIYHGCCYSPEDAQWPGWNFYASVEFNPRNTIWRDLPAMNDYYTRVQSILQSGKPDNEILVYWPIFDVYDEPLGNRGPDIRFTVHAPWLRGSALGKTATWLSEKGYSFDYISDAQLVERAKLDPYKVIVVPSCKNMPVATLQKLISLAESGATVVFEDTLPTDVPGFGSLEKRRAEFKASLENLNALVQQNKVIVGPLEASLAKAKITREALVDSGLRYVRRTHDAGHHYFIANLTGKPIEGWMPLSVPCASVAILDALTGKTGIAAKKDGSVYLQLAPGESCILRTFTSKQIDGEKWAYLAPGGEPVSIGGEWTLSSTQGALPIEPIKLQKLGSWTSLGNDTLNKLAGTMSYRVEFDAPTTTADEWMLDLGDVRESARVVLNGENVATLWSVPFRVPVGKFVKPGKNTLEIQVTNLAANAIRDLDARGIVWKKFHEINFVNINYRPFDASQWKIVDSGLLGPVTLTPMKAAELK